ncbi:hypothetical protein [Shewanella xiamenensis]|uniref:hypothetical protein n=2 Tax=Shewanella xiamenensis TaxID=332186 RepID=UPI00313D7BE5
MNGMFKGSRCLGGLPDSVSLYQALIEVDCDNNAEYVAIFDRHMRLFNYEQLVIPNKVNKLIVPFRYSNAHDLIVMIVDEERSFSSKIIDGAKAEIINARTVNIRV